MEEKIEVNDTVVVMLRGRRKVALYKGKAVGTGTHHIVDLHFGGGEERDLRMVPRSDLYTLTRQPGAV